MQVHRISEQKLITRWLLSSEAFRDECKCIVAEANLLDSKLELEKDEKIVF